ncbi:hypothetical protein RAC89_17300 [Paenibacillus sp. GD4]|uniref:hypothetical protein n=1 Tax=Paenibacillus sp. GD4 TaxID=3068890 RepID=UPI0027969BFA|nr:hypothetical protein [Paenibacillus sp. GD4]MDQ1912145.1 hypothetical protein [Paenibacillus sp. GD4]
MELTIYTILSWYTLQLMMALPRKLPLAVNVLTYMILSIVDINKFTYCTHTLQFVRISHEIPKFLSVILHRDIIFTLSLLIFANVVLTARSAKIKWGMTLYTFVFCIADLILMRSLGIIETEMRIIFCNMAIILILMGLSLLTAKWLLKLEQRRRAHDGREKQPHL